MNSFVKWSNDNQGLITVISIIAAIVLVAFGALLAGLVVVVLLCIFFIVSHRMAPKQGQVDHVNSVATDNITRQQPKKKIIVDVTPEYLIKHFKDHMSIHAQKLVNAFIGKWMKVSGPIGNVGAFNGTFSQVTFSDRSIYSGGQVYMLFRDQGYIKDRLSVLKKGDKITVIGQITRIDHDVQLDNCELVGT